MNLKPRAVCSVIIVVVDGPRIRVASELFQFPRFIKAVDTRIRFRGL